MYASLWRSLFPDLWCTLLPSKGFLHQLRAHGLPTTASSLEPGPCSFWLTCVRPGLLGPWLYVRRLDGPLDGHHSVAWGMQASTIPPVWATVHVAHWSRGLCIHTLLHFCPHSIRAYCHIAFTYVKVQPSRPNIPHRLFEGFLWLRVLCVRGP